MRKLLKPQKIASRQQSWDSSTRSSTPEFITLTTIYTLLIRSAEEKLDFYSNYKSFHPHCHCLLSVKVLAIAFLICPVFKLPPFFRKIIYKKIQTVISYIQPFNFCSFVFGHFFLQINKKRQKVFLHNHRFQSSLWLLQDFNKGTYFALTRSCGRSQMSH